MGKPLPKNSRKNGDRIRLEGLVADLSQNRDDLGAKIQRQADDLKLKNGQLRNGAEREVRSKEQIHMLTEALESAADGIFIINAHKTGFPVIYANRSFQKMTGYAKKDILGRNYFLLYGTGADRRVANEIKHIIRRGKSFHAEMLNFQKGGKKYWNLLRITPLRGAGGAVTHYVGIQTDVTLMREKELEIDEQREELLHVTRVGKLAEFVSSLAHEISQPLTAILSYAQAARRILGGKHPELAKILSYIVDDDQRAAAVIQRLRTLLKKNKPEIKPLDINALIRATVMLIAADATLRNDILKVKLKSGLPKIYGDRIQIQQVLLNLISNSFDALENNKGEREILISTSLKNSGAILVEVKDSGCGIPLQNISKLFARFFTSKPDGLGMGLSISRSIVEAHGGRLDVKNNTGRGATFYFTLPAGRKKSHE
ncbi:MAG: PAS domain-containing protein [Candidatus Omnitrophica bacterium]|nr:PAS domain-containing protein [Candidatus Omnitrophota bacterium]